MKYILIAFGIILSLIIFVGVVTAFYAIGVRNEFVAIENGVVAQYDQNKNNYDNYVKKILEIAQVPTMYKKGLEDVTRQVIAGRKGGPNEVFRFIKEHNPNFDSSLYLKVQQEISAGRDKFEEDQKMLIEKKQIYKTRLDTFPSGTVAQMFGFPRVDLEKIGIITSDRTERAFETKKDDAIKLE